VDFKWLLFCIKSCEKESFELYANSIIGLQKSFKTAPEKGPLFGAILFSFDQREPQAFYD
jgi:hypothetical protein